MINSSEAAVETGNSPKIQLSRDPLSVANDQVTIAIVEDERLVAENLKETLEDEGFKVVAMAASGAEAITRITASNPDLILMDIRLKGEMDGIQAAIELQNRWRRNLRIIFLTAHSQKQFPHIGGLDPAFIYLTKPYSQEQLFAAIRRLL